MRQIIGHIFFLIDTVMEKCRIPRNKIRNASKIWVIENKGEGALVDEQAYMDTLFDIAI